MNNRRSLVRSLVRHLVPNAGTVLLLVLFLWVQSAGAFPFRAPQGPADTRISYQGRLAGADGQPLAGAYDMTFAVYTDPSGGAPLWSEIHPGVVVSDGLFSVLLGSVAALPDPMPAGNLYLGITVGGEEITPRSLLSSSYHALEASLAATVTDGAVGTAQLADSSVTAAKIATGAVGTDQVMDESLVAADLATDSVGAAEITAGAVGTSEVADNSLAAVDLATDSVGAAEIAAGAVGTSEVADNSLAAVDLATDSVGAAEIAAGAVGTSEVADNSLTATDLASDSVTASEIAVNAVGNSELASNAVASANIQDGQVTSADITDNTITETDISDSFKARDADKLDGLDSPAYLHVSGDTMDGPLAIGNQGTIEAKTDSGGGGPHMVFETGDCFVFQNAAMRLRLCGDQYGVSFIGHTWFYFNDTIVPGEDSSYDLGSSGNRRWRSIYVRNVYSGDISEDKDLDFKADTGDVVVWQNDRLVKSTEANDPTVFGVAKVTDDRPAGSPVTLGIFVVKVTGPVREGDILVTSQIPGYAMATDDPAPGAAIAQALEDFEGERGLIKAMIRKF